MFHMSEFHRNEVSPHRNLIVNKLKIITVISDEENIGFFLLKLSCAVNKLELVTLVGSQNLFTSNRSKDFILGDYLEELDEDELILFTDGYDALLISNQNEIVSKFKTFNKEIVFSTETNCWPDQNMAARYPKQNCGPYKYLNSGGYIGKVGAIKEFLNDPSFTSDKFEKSNQYLWAQVFLNNQHRIGIDTDCKIFCSFSPEAGTAYLPKENNDYYDYYKFMSQWFNEQFSIEQSRIFNKTTQTWPCHAHFNGDAKVLMDSSIKDMLISRISDPLYFTTLYAQFEKGQ
jgi:hypothetical protein